MRHLLPALALFVCFLTLAYSAIRLSQSHRDSGTVLGFVRTVWRRIVDIFHQDSRPVELACAIILLIRGAYGMAHVPQTARRLEDSWLLVAYVAIACSQICALLTSHRRGRRVTALLQAVIWVTISIQIYRIDHELVNSFPVFAGLMAWVAIRLLPEDR